VGDHTRYLVRKGRDVVGVLVQFVFGHAHEGEQVALQLQLLAIFKLELLAQFEQLVQVDFVRV